MALIRKMSPGAWGSKLRIYNETRQLSIKLFDSLEIAKFAPKERTKYINDMTTERDIKNQIDYARKEGEAKGKAEGKAEGIAEGKEEGNIETARKLIAEYGLDPEDVAKRLGMKKEDLQ